MKKIILITSLFLFTISIVTAQEDVDSSSNPYSFGVRVGSNIYDIKAEYDSVSETGLYGGLFIERALSEKWALRFEANYAGLSVLQFPLLLKYKLSDKIEFYGGAQLDLSTAQRNTRKEFRNKDFGASLVIGMQYNINSRWFIEGRYIYGLSDQFPIFQGFDSESLYANKRSFNFGIGYKF